MIDADAERITVSTLDSCDRASGTPVFQPVADSGIDFVHRSAPHLEDALGFAFGAGGAAGDFDGDGLVDLVLIDQAGAHGYFRNLGALRFERIPDAGGLVTNSPANGASAADWDSDGDLDLLVMTDDRDRLFENRDGQFVDITDSSGVMLDSRTLAVSWADLDYDGDLDLFSCSYPSWRDEPLGMSDEVGGDGCTNQLDDDGDGLIDCEDPDCAPLIACEGPVGSPNWVYLNNGDGSFTDRTDLLPGSELDSACFASTIADLDGDGLLDIATTHDKGDVTEPDQFFRGRPDGTFEEVSAERGLDQCCALMGVSVGDFDGDGSLDLWKSDTPSDHLVFNDGSGHFYDATATAGVQWEGGQPTTWNNDNWDIDEDGDLDTLVLAAPYGNIARDEPTPNLVYLNDGTGSFEERGADVGLALPELQQTRSSIRADFDLDGAQDVLLPVADGPPLLLAGQCTDNGRLLVELRNSPRHPTLAGAVVEIEAGGRTQQRVVVVGGQVQSSQPGHLHFGLGGAEVIDQLTITWPDGSAEKLGPLEPNSRVIVQAATK